MTAGGRVPAPTPWHGCSHPYRTVSSTSGPVPGALSRQLIGRVGELVAVEPDARMRDVLQRNVPEALVLEGSGEKLPLEDASIDAILVSSAWHWMDVDATVAEAARVLRPGGMLGVIWSGVDWTDRWFGDLRAAVHRQETDTRLLSWIAEQVIPDDNRALVLPDDAPFTSAEQQASTWAQTMSAEQLVRMVGTFSSVILLDEAQRRQTIEEARRLLREQTGLEGDMTIAVPFRADCWRTVRDGDCPRAAPVSP